MRNSCWTFPLLSDLDFISSPLPCLHVVIDTSITWCCVGMKVSLLSVVAQLCGTGNHCKTNFSLHSAVLLIKNIPKPSFNEWRAQSASCFWLGPHSVTAGLPNQSSQGVRRMSTSKATAPGKQQRDVAERRGLQFVFSPLVHAQGAHKSCVYAFTHARCAKRVPWSYAL